MRNGGRTLEAFDHCARVPGHRRNQAPARSSKARPQMKRAPVKRARRLRAAAGRGSCMHPRAFRPSRFSLLSTWCTIAFIRCTLLDLSDERYIMARALIASKSVPWRHRRIASSVWYSSAGSATAVRAALTAGAKRITETDCARRAGPQPGIGETALSELETNGGQRARARAGRRARAPLLNARSAGYCGRRVAARYFEWSDSTVLSSAALEHAAAAAAPLLLVGHSWGAESALRLVRRCFCLCRCRFCPRHSPPRCRRKTSASAARPCLWRTW